LVSQRFAIFARDDWRCVYCGQSFPEEELTVDHVQPRVARGDSSPGNLVTACKSCNRAKGHTKLARFLVENPIAQQNFFSLATHVWPRHMKAVEDEMRSLARRGHRKVGER